jgi:hypothetical protein
MAERLGTGLQNLLERFNSASRLQHLNRALIEGEKNGSTE